MGSTTAVGSSSLRIHAEDRQTGVQARRTAPRLAVAG
jgi:hypothetical protein